MSRFLIILIAFTATFGSYASESKSEANKAYRKLVEKYDVSDEVKTVEEGNPNTFWLATLVYNELHNKFQKDIKKNRGAEKEAADLTRNLPRFYPEYDESVVGSMNGYCDSLLSEMGIKDLDLNCSLYVVESDDVNSFVTLTEDGFAMCLTTGLLSRKGINREIIMGYVAREFAHGALSHFERGFYETAKARRSNERAGIWAGLFISVVDGLSTVYSSDDSDVYEVYLLEKNRRDREKIDDAVKLSTIEFSDKYSCEQIFEADLIAYRFLEYLGMEDSAINGLKILGASNDLLYVETAPDRPSISARIDFLNYVKSNPKLGNRINQKLRKQLANK